MYRFGQNNKIRKQNYFDIWMQFVKIFNNFFFQNIISFLQPVLIYNDLPLKFLIYNGGKKVIKVVKFINENFCMIFLKIFFIKGFICAHIRNYFRQSLLKELRFITHYIIFLLRATGLQPSNLSLQILCLTPPLVLRSDALTLIIWSQSCGKSELTGCHCVICHLVPSIK